jgi:hypothetical protein
MLASRSELEIPSLSCLSFAVSSLMPRTSVAILVIEALTVRSTQIASYVWSTFSARIKSALYLCNCANNFSFSFCVNGHLSLSTPFVFSPVTRSLKCSKLFSSSFEGVLSNLARSGLSGLVAKFFVKESRRSDRFCNSLRRASACAGASFMFLQYWKTLMNTSAASSANANAVPAAPKAVTGSMRNGSVSVGIGRTEQLPELSGRYTNFGTRNDFCNTLPKPVRGLSKIKGAQIACDRLSLDSRISPTLGRHSQIPFEIAVHSHQNLQCFLEKRGYSKLKNLHFTWLDIEKSEFRLKGRHSSNHCQLQV